MATITLFTYENQESPVFEVEKTWLEKYVREQYGQSIEDFLDTYTWDDTEHIYTEAKKAGVCQPVKVTNS